MKAKPKSCSCQQCTFGKHTKGGQKEVKHDERSFRHKMKQLLNKGLEIISVAPKGNYYD